MLQIDKFKLPVVAAPMFLISGPELVISCCKAGVMGTFPALNQRTSEGFEQWLSQIKEALEDTKCQVPYGVNLIVHGTNTRLQPDLSLCVKHMVPVVITSLGAVSEVVDAVHSYGGIVLHDVTTRRHAEKAIEAGVDGLILVCAGAGGHAGTMHPVPFVHEVRSMFDGLVLLSGALSTGQDVASAMQMGADLAYMGTRFIAVNESKATESYRQMIIDSKISDIVYTAAISGVPASFMKQSLDAAGVTKEMWKQTAKIDFGKEMDTEAKAWKTIWSAGQGVTSIDRTMSVDELVTTLHREMRSAVEQQHLLLERF